MVSLPAATRMGAVRLRTRRIEDVATFYRETLGLHEQHRTSAGIEFGNADGMPLVRLDYVAKAERRPPRTTGLYHFALLFPDRAALGAAIRDVAAADHAFHGFADHLVSEAAYLADPEDNGIELYRDRPRAEWQIRESTILMSTELLDVPALLAEADFSPAPPGRSSDLRMGHVHLHVASNERAAAFYTEVIGFDITNRDYPGAIFMSAGGYHHHLAVNEWGTRTPPPPETTGLVEFEIIVPDQATVDGVAARASSASAIAPTEAAGRNVLDGNTGEADGLTLVDPDGHGVVIRVAP